MTKISKNQIALAGEFAVLSQLSLKGFDANLTLGNTKGVDILLSHPETGTMRRLEVKTHSHNRSYYSKEVGQIVSKWSMNEKHEHMNDSDLFFCFVSIQNSSNVFKFYIIPSAVVAEYVKWSHAFWLKNNKKRVDTPMRTFQLGSCAYEYQHNIPLAEDYENNWDLLL